MADTEREEQRKSLSRREFLAGAGASVAVGAAGLAGCVQPQVAQPAAQQQAPGTPCPEPETIVKEVPVEVPDWPWPYAKLDPEEVRKRGHQGYYADA